MFLRKLLVMVVPLGLLVLLCVVVPCLNGLGFLSPVLQGAMIGTALALVLPLSGAIKAKAHFGRLLWVPCAAIAAVLALQYAMSLGVQLSVLSLLATSDGQMVLMESLTMVYLGITAARA